MKYRTFGKLDWKPSALGFGTMRLPLTDNDQGHVDEAETTRLIHYAIDHGVNYVDTAYAYHNEVCESVVGRVLQNGYREKVKLATKLPCYAVESAKDFDRYLNEQLRRLQTGKIDFYLLHTLKKWSWEKVRDLKVFDWAEKAMADGRIEYLGFSFHDELDVFKDIIDYYDNWTMCQIQYNYMDVRLQAGTRGLKYAAKRGLGVVIMEPLRGGQLAKEPPKKVAKIWENAPQKRSYAEFALLWLWQHPEVSVVLSGMNRMDHLQENMAIADKSSETALSAKELALISRVRETYKELMPIPCTNCRYCMPCPNGVEIPRIFAMYNDTFAYENPRAGRGLYSGIWGLRKEQQADNCQECGECMKVCPQKIAIPDWLKKIHAHYTS
jgi:predicted aldo/keto reductase-like oxidoreductase